MADDPSERIKTRDLIRGLLSVAVLTAAVVGLVIWVLASFVLPCGCLTPA